MGLRSTLSHRYLQQQRQHPYVDYRTWANRQSRDLESEVSSPGYQAGIFHLPANAGVGVSAHNPLSHYNPLLHEQVFGDASSPVLAGAAIKRQQQHSNSNSRCIRGLSQLPAAINTSTWKWTQSTGNNISFEICDNIVSDSGFFKVL